MYLTALGTIQSRYGTGNTLKAACIAAVTLAELDAVIDTR
jgi:hypothetical protein